MATAAQHWSLDSIVCTIAARHEALRHITKVDSPLFAFIIIAFFTTHARSRIHAFARRMELDGPGYCSGNGTQCRVACHYTSAATRPS
jgi:hypothetical protein